jgi:hypothetical protein
VLQPLPERITRVQVVRGIGTSALEFSGAEGEAVDGAAPPVDPAAMPLVGAAVAPPAN